jgi:protein-disulfide isomerase
MKKAPLLLLLTLLVLAAFAAGASATGGSLVDRLPQEGLTLGKKGAPVELIEFGDLQCPICKEYAEEILPRVIRKQVATGKAKLTFRNFVIIGPESFPAGAAAIAAGAQGRGWNFIETWYRNQGEENSGYVTEGFIEAVARAAGIKDMAAWNKARKSKAVRAEETATTKSAEGTLRFHATPSFAIEGPKTDGLKLLGTPESTEELEEAIAKAG